MPFIPHTPEDVRHMLDTIGAPSIDALFDEIPTHLQIGSLQAVPEGISEMTLMRVSAERAALDAGRLCFIGAGAYEHHVPAAVWDIATRGEFMTAYTPYQAEASQGTLQLIYEYQSMMSSLTGLDVSNASLYDGASALAEAVLMAVRANRKSDSNRVLVLGSVHPHYRRCVESIVEGQGITLQLVPFDAGSLLTPVDALAPWANDDFAALVIPMPNFFGAIEDVHALTDWAHARNQLVIGVVNPMALAIFTPPGEWGQKGADIAVGEGQPMGIPLASGGPFYGFICCRQELVRQMPGRIIGRTVDLEGKRGFVLTLQAREQHIRRSKATSNICTNQGLAVTASTIYMSLMGADGLEQVAAASHAGARALREKVSAVPGISLVGSETFFHEFVIRLPKPTASVLASMEQDGVLAGYALDSVDAALANCLLVCVTETRTAEDIERYVAALTRACQ